MLGRGPSEESGGGGRHSYILPHFILPHPWTRVPLPSAVGKKKGGRETTAIRTSFN